MELAGCECQGECVCRELIMAYFEMFGLQFSLEQSQEAGHEDGVRRAKGRSNYNVKVKLFLSTT
jgi:hypothetical protein